MPRNSDRAKKNNTYIQFANDQVIIANDREDIEYIVRKLMEEYKK